MGNHRAALVRRHRFTTTAVAFGLLLALSIPAFAGGPVDKATGSGSWINGGGSDFYAEFNAHEATDGRDAKGSLYQALNDGTGGFTVEVDQVTVYDGHACFGGWTESAWGAYAGELGEYRWTVVRDGGSGTDEVGGDYLRGGWTGADTSTPAWCANGNTASNEAWYSGNVQLHTNS